MTCKDCIHENVCSNLYPQRLLPCKSDKYPAEKFCLEFINKTNYAEVRHGYWIKAQCSEKDGDAHCSECNHFDWSDCDYCSKCGTRMDGECK